MTEQAISFGNIPKTSRLYKDFLYDFARVAPRFYEAEGRDLASLVARAPRVLAQSFARDAVADVLKEQNLNAGAGAATLANLERLRQNDAVVIITGQQAGLFGGPLYTVFKALTALKLAERLRAEGVNAVPMFWIAAEDHDFEEVNHTRLVNREGQLTTVTYTACSPKEGKPVGHVVLCDEIAQNIDELLAALPESEFIPQLKEDLTGSYQAGTDFGTAFGKLMMRWLGRFGVVLINPLDDRLKHISGEIYLRAMKHQPQFADTLVKESAALEAAGYHAQVYTSAEAVPLFMLDEGRRTAMTRHSDGRFHLKGNGKSFAADELLSTVERCPNCFSPNVTLRPIVQDFLLPTLAYIGGPAEIAYFAQLRPNYELLKRVPPVVLPRASFSLIEHKQAKTFDKYQLSFQDLFNGLEETLRKIVEQGPDAATIAVFAETEQQIGEQLEKLRASLSVADASLADALKGGREKILYQLSNLRTRFVNNRSKRDETMHQQIERLFALLYPNKGLQERELNFAYFLARYGYDVIDKIYAATEPGSGEHKLIYL